VRARNHPVVNSPRRAKPPSRRREFKLQFAMVALEPRRLLTASLSTLYPFGLSGAADAANPDAGLLMDASGNLFGTTYGGGTSGNGTVFEIANGSDNETVLYSFSGGSDGVNPIGGLVMDSSGNLYGTTISGGTSGVGTIFELPQGQKTDNVLYSFSGGSDGANPLAGLTMDSSGNLYGTTPSGGTYASGTIYVLPKDSSTDTILYSFSGGDDGDVPYAGLTIDSDGDLFGTTAFGGDNGYGAVFELPVGNTVPTTLYSFSGGDDDDGSYPLGDVILDSAGDLYGTTSSGGTDDDGTIFEIPNGSSSDIVLASFSGGADGATPYTPLLLMDSAGNLYGTTASGGGDDDGTVFEWVKGNPTDTTLYSFTGGNDGATPLDGVIMDSNGKLYGTTDEGGANGLGTVFELAIAPPGISASPGAEYTVTGPAGGQQTLNVTAGSVTLTSDLSNSLGNYVLSISDGASVILASSQNVGGIQFTGSGTLDIGIYSVSINYAAAGLASPLTTIQQDLARGYASGAWNGTGIVSSTAAAYPGIDSVGYADGSVDAGTPATPGELLIKYTRAGDALLNGTVNFNDLDVIGTHLNTSGNDWAEGNFNYDPNGAVNFNDLDIVGQNLNTQVTPAAGASEAMGGTTLPLSESATPPADATTAITALSAPGNLYDPSKPPQQPPTPNDPDAELLKSDAAPDSILTA
jgi:uncharacterized repeat protein (TIGR03803 family)